MIYEQKKRFENLENFEMASSRSLNGRANFNVQEFAKEHDLGKPLIANYFVARTHEGNKAEEKYIKKFYAALEDEDEDDNNNDDDNA